MATTTYQSAVERVALECLNRTDLDVQIQAGIQATIRRYEGQRFWFNESSTVLTASVSIETVAVPTDFLFLDQIRVTENSADLPLVWAPFSLIRQINLNHAVGLPTRYHIYGQNFYLANVPDSAYALPTFYVHRVAQLVNPTDTNSWLSAAEDVLVFGAASYVSALIGDMPNAEKWKAAEITFYQQDLLWKRDAYGGGRLTMTRF